MPPKRSGTLFCFKSTIHRRWPSHFVADVSTVMDGIWFSWGAARGKPQSIRQNAEEGKHENFHTTVIPSCKCGKLSHSFTQDLARAKAQSHPRGRKIRMTGWRSTNMPGGRLWQGLKRRAGGCLLGKQSRRSRGHPVRIPFAQKKAMPPDGRSGTLRTMQPPTAMAQPLSGRRPPQGVRFSRGAALRKTFFHPVERRGRKTQETCTTENQPCNEANCRIPVNNVSAHETSPCFAIQRS